MNQLAVLMRREFWEHRSMAWVPLAFGGLFLLAVLLSVVGLVRFSVDVGEVTITEMASHVRPEQWAPGMEVAFTSLAAIFNMVMSIVVFFYLVDALYTERRDRSILFWKSLPVSDAKVVASKFLSATLLIPAITLGVFILTAVAIWLVAGVTVLVLGDSGAIANGPAAILRSAVLFTYTLLVQSLWFAPFFAWVLLASAWARRAALLWVFLPPVAVIVAEKILLDGSRFAETVGEHFWKGYPLAFGGGDSMIGWEDGPHRLHGIPEFAGFLTPGPLLASGELWIGIALAIAFLAAATWLRRYRDEA